MKKIILLTCIFCSVITVGIAQSGTLDPTFGTGGKVITPVGTNDEYGNSVAIQPDGKMIVAGSSYSMGYDFVLIRYNDDGSLDNTFGTGGIVLTDFGLAADEAHAVVVQTDGKIVAVGRGGLGFTDDPTKYDFAIARYNSNGTLDNTFGSGGKVLTDLGTSSSNSTSDAARSVAIQNDGKIVVGGYTENAYTPGTSNFALVRYNNNGTLDGNFGSGGKIITDFGGERDIVNSIAIQNDGRIIAAGSTDIDFGASTYNYDFAIARYNTDGSLDNNFDADGKLTTEFFGSLDDGAASVLVQTDGKIVAAGTTNVGNYQFALVRYNSDGSLDNTFDSDGKVTTLIGNSSQGSSACLQVDGKILVAGYSSDTNYNVNAGIDFAVARYNSDGSLDVTFDTDGKVTTDFGGVPDGDFANSIAVRNDGKIVVAGSKGHNTSSTNFIWDIALARYNNTLFTGINNTSSELAQTIYPNPSSGIFSITCGDCANSGISIHTLIGDCVEYDCRNRNQVIEIDLTSQPKGIYFIEVTLKGQITRTKVIVQ
jgi:uncharacterized delta-60 repeat protein